MAEDRVGTITHYFGKPEVGVIRLEADVRVGDVLHFRGRTTDFEQPISSMEVEHGPVEEAGAGTEVAVKVRERVRQGDEVFRVTPD